MKTLPIELRKGETYYIDIPDEEPEKPDFSGYVLGTIALIFSLIALSKTF